MSDVKGGVSDTPGRPTASASCSWWVSPIRAIRQDDDDKTAADKKKTRPPIVIDRYHFKEDVQGYLRNERTHLYLFDVATKKAGSADHGHAARRRVAGLVARRHADRLRQQARLRRSRSPRRTPTSG